MDRGHVLGKLRVGKTLVRAKPTPARGVGIIRGEDLNPPRCGPLVDDLKMIRKRRDGVGSKRAQVTADYCLRGVLHGI